MQNDMERFIRQLAGKIEEEDGEKKKSKKQGSVLSEAIIMQLREVGPRFNAPNPYKVDDVVTPAPWSTYRNVGEPHLVIAVGGSEGVYNGAPESHVYGKRADIRVLSLIEEHIVTHWVDSSEFDFWKKGN